MHIFFKVKVFLNLVHKYYKVDSNTNGFRLKSWLNLGKIIQLLKIYVNVIIYKHVYLSTLYTTYV